MGGWVLDPPSWEPVDMVLVVGGSVGGWVLDPPSWEPVGMVLVVGGREVVWEDGY